MFKKSAILLSLAAAALLGPNPQHAHAGGTMKMNGDVEINSETSYGHYLSFKTVDETTAYHKQISLYQNIMSFGSLYNDQQSSVFKFYNGGTEPVMTLNGSGNLGVGITPTTYKLDVAGNSRITGPLIVSTGNLGVGTTSPAYKLDVAGQSRLSGKTLVSSGYLDIAGDSTSLIRAYGQTANPYIKFQHTDDNYGAHYGSLTYYGGTSGTNNGRTYDMLSWASSDMDTNADSVLDTPRKNYFLLRGGSPTLSFLARISDATASSPVFTHRKYEITHLDGYNYNNTYNNCLIVSRIEGDNVTKNLAFFRYYTTQLNTGLQFIANNTLAELGTGFVGLYKDTNNNVTIVSEDKVTNLNGGLNFNDAGLTTYPSELSVGFYRKDGNIFVKDLSHDGTQLSTHADPREHVSNAMTSFSDSSVTLPYSFHHLNSVLGKGEVIDMAKLVAWVEQKMQDELGEEQGKLKFEYDLPKDECLSADKWQEDVLLEQAEKLLAEVEALPWLKVTDGAGAIPEEAIEIYEETVEQIKTVEEEQLQLDIASRQVKRIKVSNEVTEYVPTGRKLERLCDGWELREDGLYRRPTLDDLEQIADLSGASVSTLGIKGKSNAAGGASQRALNLDDDLRAQFQGVADRLVKQVPQLPDWMQIRLNIQGTQTQDVSKLINKLSELLQAKAANQTQNQNVAMND